MPYVQPLHFPSGAEFRRWLLENHESASELTLLFYNKGSGRGGITYAEALDEALCFGWIDGLVRKVDAQSHTRRFTPRRPGSIWSRVNLGHVERLIQSGRMHPAGLRVFASRDAAKCGVYSFEQRSAEFPSQLRSIFERNVKAWTFWSAQPPGYRRIYTWWVISAKRPETQERRLATLMRECQAGRRLP